MLQYPCQMLRHPLLVRPNPPPLGVLVQVMVLGITYDITTHSNMGCKFHLNNFTSYFKS